MTRKPDQPEIQPFNLLILQFNHVVTIARLGFNRISIYVLEFKQNNIEITIRVSFYNRKQKFQQERQNAIPAVTIARQIQSLRRMKDR